MLTTKRFSSFTYLAYLLVAILTLNFYSKPLYAEATSIPLVADQAFNFTLTFNERQQLIAHWSVAPGYYLYRERFNITVDGKPLLNVNYPQGDFKYDNELGRFEVLSGEIYVPLIVNGNQQSQVTVYYQGCAEDGFCYPPTTKNFTVNFINHTVIANDLTFIPTTKPTNINSLQQLATEQTGVQHLLASQHFIMQILILAALGLLLAFTPCVLPMIPILTSIIVGQKNKTTRSAFFLSLTYVIGTSVTYALAGLAAALMGSSLQVWLQTPIVIGMVCVIFVLLALSLFGVFELQLPSSWQNKLNTLSNKQQGGTYAGALAMGMISTLIVSPCVTAPLVGVLLYIAQTGNVVFGASALFALGIGMGIPLLIIGVSAGKWLPNKGPWMLVVKYIFGIIMLMMAVWLSTRIFSHVATLTPANSNFTIVRNVNELDQQLMRARAQNKSVVIDFYADWCASCIAMDKNVFAKPNVQAALSNYVLLRADLSANTKDDQALLTHLNVIAPPTVLILSNEGKESDAERIVGEVNAKEFLTRLNHFGQNVVLK